MLFPPTIHKKKKIKVISNTYHIMLRNNRRLFISSSSSSLDIKAAFKILALNPSPTTTPEDARQQYLKLARQYHPDVSNGDDTKMKQVNLAYEVVQHYASTSGGNFSSLYSNNNENSQNRKKSKHDMSAAERAEAEKQGRRSGDEDDGFGGSDDDHDSSASWREKRQQQKKKRLHQQQSQKSNLSDASTWNTRPEFEWNAAIFNVNEIDAANPRNHPHTFNRHFSFNDDSTIFRATRSGATAEEIARSIGRSAFAIEARMNSTQFKLRIQKMLKSSEYQRRNNITREDTERAARSTTSTFSGGNINNNNIDQDINASSTTQTHEQDQEEEEMFANGRRQGQMMSSRTEAKRDFSRQVHPFQDTVYRNPIPPQRKNASSRVQEGDLPFMHPEEIEEAFAKDGRYLSEEDDEFDNTFNQFSGRRIQSAHGRTYHHLMNHMKKGSKKSGGTFNKKGFY